MNIMNKPLVLLLLALSAFAWATSVKASWVDLWDALNSGYCASAPPGLPVGHYFVIDASLCPENLKRSGIVKQQKSQSARKPTGKSRR